MHYQVQDEEKAIGEVGYQVTHVRVVPLILNSSMTVLLPVLGPQKNNALFSSLTFRIGRQDSAKCGQSDMTLR